MRTNSRCGLHQGPPRPAQPLRYMPARRSSPKPPKVAYTKADLAALGFRMSDSGPHTSKTLMLQELEASATVTNSSVLKNSSLNRLLNDSAKPFCHGDPGSM